MAIEREALPSIGPAFRRNDDGEVEFVHVVDPTNVIGPRVATDKDKADNAGALAHFEAEEKAEKRRATDAKRRDQDKIDAAVEKALADQQGAAKAPAEKSGKPSDVAATTAGGASKGDGSDPSPKTPEAEAAKNPEAKK